MSAAGASDPASSPDAAARAFDVRGTGSAVAAMALTAVPMAVVAMALLGSGRGGWAYSSDLVHPFMVVQDVLRDWGSLWTWHHSPAFYVFPDWFVAFAIMAFTGEHMAWPLIYAAIIFAFHASAGGMLLAAGNGRPVYVGVCVAAAALVVAVGLVVVTDYLGGRHRLFVPLAMAYIHSGAVWAAMASAALMLLVLAGRGGRLHEAALGAAVFAAAFSDLLFVAWFVMPGMATAALHAWCARRCAGLRVAAIIAVAAGAGLLIDQWLHAVWRHVVVAGTSQSGALSLAWAEIEAIAARGDVPMLLALAISLAAIARGAAAFFAALRRRPLEPPATASLFLGAAAAAAMTAPLAFGTFASPDQDRYFVAVPMLAVIVAAHWLLGAQRGASARVIARTGATVAVVGALALAWPAAAGIPRLVAKPALQRCIEAEGRKEGFGDYWTAKQTMFASGRAIHIVQIEPDGKRMRWNYNERWFTVRADDGLPLKPDFIVAARLSSEALRRRFGAPSRTVSCEGNAIWLYDRPLPVPP